MPEVAVSGQTTAALVTLTGAATSFGPANVTIRLVSDRIEEMTQLYAKVTHEIRGKSLLPVRVERGRVRDGPLSDRDWTFGKRFSFNDSRPLTNSQVSKRSV